MCVFARSFGVQAVAEWCAKYDENYVLNLDPVSPVGDDTVALGQSAIASPTAAQNVSGVMDESGEVAHIDFQHHLSERLGEQGVDAPVPQIPEALVDGSGDPVEQMVDVDVMASQIVEDVFEHADEVEFLP